MVYTGVIDWDGNIVIPFEYSFCTHLTPVIQKHMVESKTEKFRIWIFSIKYKWKNYWKAVDISDLKFLPDGNIQVEQNNLYGVVTPENQILLETKSDSNIHVFEYQNKFYANAKRS